MDFKKLVEDSFEKLKEDCDFKVKTELFNGQSFRVEYSSKDFVIQIENYFREIYTSLYKINRQGNQINLFNLLGYLRQGNPNVPESEYFRKEKDLQDSYMKQLNHISSTIYENLTLLNEFFSSDDYDLKITEFQKYWKNKHPEFYPKA